MSNKPMIKHQQQPCPVSCFATCIAMLSGNKVSDMDKRIHEGYRDQTISIRQCMMIAGVTFQSFDTCDLAPLNMQGAYMCGVPSLNIEGGTHMIVIEVTESDYYVFDPCMGREGKRYYVKRGSSSSALEVDLNCADPVALVHRSWLASRDNEEVV